MLEELLLAKRPEPKYSITQVVEKAKDLGISYGWCSYLLSVGKSLYGMKGERLYDADYEVRRIDGRFCPAGR